MGLPRIRLATQLSLILCAISMFSTGLALILQERSLSSELEQAARERLERAASAADRLVETHLRNLAERYRAVSRTPELRANLEVGDGPTLGYFAAQLARQQDAELILFLDPDGSQRLRSGDKALGRTVRAALASRDGGVAVAANPAGDGGETRLLAHEGRLHALTVTPLLTRGRLVGQLVAVERIPEETVAAWSELCGARIRFGPSESEPGPLDLPVRRLGGFELRVAGSLDAEREALAHTRRKLLAAGLIAVAMAFASSFFLARRWVRPILALQDATERIGRGDLGVRLRAGRRDELGDVARAFDHMAERLKQTVGEVRHLAYHDTLTGLGNRRLFEERLHMALEQARREGLGVAVLFLDLDHFKYVNDTLGHTLGDRLLEQCADRLVAALQEVVEEPGCRGTEAGGVARFGGDEFTLMLSGLRDPQEAGSVARRVLHALSAPFELAGHEVTVGASIGISTFPEDGRDVETLLRNCDTAMYHAKQQGRNGHQFFAEYMNVIAAKRLVLEGRLRRAVEDESLTLHYQPKVELETGRIVGLEALARWREGDLGAVAPEEFVRLAEESGLIHEMGDWVLRTAVGQLAEWQRAGLPPLRVAVNLSAHQLERATLPGRIDELLAAAGVDPGRLELEVTESVLLKDEEHAIETLGALRARGLHVSLDDFGTGFSSLSYLRRLPIDTVKIDQSFVRDAGEDGQDGAIVSAIISLAKVLGLRVVAEGVETEAQLAFLREVGCDEIQGFLVSPAVPAAEVPKLAEGLDPDRRKRRRRAPRGRLGRGKA